MRVRTRTWLAAGALALAALAIFAVVTRRYGFSAADEPTHVEAMIARTVRHWAVPADLRNRKNPLPLTPELLAEARAHYADHCATCHGNDGRGNGTMGAQMYPRTPDLTLPTTQRQSDGELFSVIENGVRLTGMPAFGNGTAGSAAGSWALVHFIRHLPELTPEELGGMEKLNPKTPEEWQEMQEEDSFLAGSDEPPAAVLSSKPARHHGH